METIYKKTIIDPPSKWVHKRTAPKQVKYKKSNGDHAYKLVHEDVHYLTANLFYADSIHWATKQKIVDFAKEWLIQHIEDIPKIEKCRIRITYYKTKDNFDIDNKAYFWAKMLLDIMKTPSQKQLARAEKYNSKVFTIASLNDDSVKFVDGVDMRFKNGKHAIKIRIKGRLLAEQTQLF